MKHKKRDEKARFVPQKVKGGKAGDTQRQIEMWQAREFHRRFENNEQVFEKGYEHYLNEARKLMEKEE